MISLISISQNYDKLIQNELKNGCFKASFQNLSNDGVALINIAKKRYINPVQPEDDSNIRAADWIISNLLTSCFDYGIKVMAYDKSIDLLDSENILKELSEKISTKARYFFLIKKGQGELYDSKNDFELVGYFKCVRNKRNSMELMADYIAQKMKESIQK